MATGTEVDDRGAKGDHVVQSYERDADLIAAVSDYVSTALLAREAAVIVATEAHRVAVDEALASSGIDVAGHRGAGRLVSLDAAATLDGFAAGGRIARGRFRSVIAPVLARAAEESDGPVRVYGEMVALLWDAGQVSAAIDLEEAWNELRRQQPCSLFCGYPSASVSDRTQIAAWGHVCRLHSAVRRQFPLRLTAPGMARRFVFGALQAQGYSGELLDDAAMVVSELATNSVLHASSPFTVAVSSESGVVRISVHDANPTLPMPRRMKVRSRSGRGLGLVAAVADGWGVERTSQGKVVWAEIPI
jgi:anti-sigma regulatory factor (Ser/Thr protein kinase)